MRWGPELQALAPQDDWRLSQLFRLFADPRDNGTRPSARCFGFDFVPNAFHHSTPDSVRGCQVYCIKATSPA